MYPSELPLSGQTDARMFGAAFAQGEEFPDNLLGFAQDQGSVGLQLGVALLERQISRPELGDHGHVQKPVSGQALQEGFEFICREEEQNQRKGRLKTQKIDKNERLSSHLHVINMLFEHCKPIHHCLLYPQWHAEMSE